jgi:hypothetical protein
MQRGVVYGNSWDALNRKRRLRKHYSIPDGRGESRTSAGSEASSAYGRTGIGKGASYLVKRDCVRCVDSTSSGGQRCFDTFGLPPYEGSVRVDPAFDRHRFRSSDRRLPRASVSVQDKLVEVTTPNVKNSTLRPTSHIGAAANGLRA